MNNINIFDLNQKNDFIIYDRMSNICSSQNQWIPICAHKAPKTGLYLCQITLRTNCPLEKDLGIQLIATDPHIQISKNGLATATTYTLNKDKSCGVYDYYMDNISICEYNKDQIMKAVVWCSQNHCFTEGIFRVLYLHK